MDNSIKAIAPNTNNLDTSAEIKIGGSVTDPRTLEGQAPKYLSREDVLRLGLEREEKTIPGVDNSPKDIYQFAMSFNGQGNKQGAKPTSRSRQDVVDNFKISTPGYTDENGKFVPYTKEQLVANPHLDTATAMEKYIRDRAITDKDEKGNPLTTQDMARNYFGNIYDSIKNINDVADPVYPMIATPENIQKYNEELQKANQGHIKAEAQARDAVLKAQEEAAKGNVQNADNILKEQALSVNIDGKQYRATNNKAAETVAELEKISPIKDKLIDELNQITDATPGKLQLALPTYARVFSKYMDPSSQISMGNIDESKMSTMVDEAHKAGLSLGPAMLAAVAVAIGKIGLKDAIKQYGESTYSSLSPKDTADRMKEMLNAAEKSVEIYKKSVLVGYKGSGTVMPGSGVDKIDTQKETTSTLADWTDKTLEPKKKVDMILSRATKWSQNPGDEAQLAGLKSGDSNLGIAKLQYMLKSGLGDLGKNYEVTGIIKPNDRAALTVFLKNNPTLTAQDIIGNSFGVDSNKIGMQDMNTTKPTKTNKGSGISGHVGGRSSSKGR